MISKTRVLAIAALAVALPSAALAHSGQANPSGFVAGFSHPFGGLDHLLAMVAVGLWGAFLGRPMITALPVIFPAFMAVGAISGMAGLPLPSVELGIALSVLSLGLAIGLAFRAPIWAACLVVGAFGFFHGFAHGQELPMSADPAAYCLGFVLATGLLHVGGIAIGAAREWKWGERAVRLAGAIIAVAGAVFVQMAIAA